MCLAIPGKVIKKDEKVVIVQYPKEQRQVLNDPHIPVKVGDWVMVQMGVVIRKLSKLETKKMGISG